LPLPGRLGERGVQSAAPCSSVRTSADRGLRFSYGITSGNEISDLADY
jgi:hypothetical protein